MEIHKQIFFEEMGALLKAKREEQKLSIEDVVDEMKFSKNMIIAMESAHVERLPNAVYAKGFYRTYATLLGIDKNIIDAFVNTAFVEKEVEAVSPFLSIQMGAEKEKNTFGSFIEIAEKKLKQKKMIIALLIVLLLLVITFYFLLTGNKSNVDEDAGLGNEPIQTTEALEIAIPLTPTEDKQEEKETAPVVSQQEEVAPQTSSPVESKVAQPQEEQPKDEVPAIQAPQEKETIKETQAEEKNVNATQEEVQESTTPPAKKERLRIVATGEVWVEAKYNGKTVHFFLQEGQERTILFSGIASIKIGDLSAATMYFRNKEMKELGEKGKVKVYTFNTNE